MPLLLHNDFGGMPEIIIGPYRKQEKKPKPNSKLIFHSGRKIIESSLLTSLMGRKHSPENIKLNVLMLPCSKTMIGKERSEK